MLAQPQIRTFAATVWRDTKDQLRAQSAQPGSELRSRLAGLIMQTGGRLRDDPELAAAGPARPRRPGADRAGAVRQGAGGPGAARPSPGGTPVETSRRLELLLGPDLQYIRINGTIVGGLAGLCLHAISVGLG